MKTIVTLSCFHRKIGPIVFYSYPADMLEKELSLKIANIMDQQFSEGFFTHSFGNLNSLNYYFEIHSDWDRGSKEMLMVSTIIDQQIPTEDEEKVSILCTEFSEQLQSNEEIYTAFYINDINNFDEEDQERIRKNEALIKAWVDNLYRLIIEDTRENTEEEEIAILLNEKHISMTLEKLSEGPILLEDLREWFVKNFPDKNFDNTIEILDKRQFIFINQIGLGKKYVLLVKEKQTDQLDIKTHPESEELDIKTPPESEEDDDSGYITTSPTIPPKPPGGTGSAKLKVPTVILKKKAESKPYCKHCGAELPEGQTICHNCGKKVE